RRDEVLDRMLRAGLIDGATHADAIARPLGLAHRAPIYGTRAPWYTEHVRRQLAEQWAQTLAAGGLTVETAALPALARTVDDEVVRAGDRLTPSGRSARDGGEPPEAAALVWDHRTGYVEAMTGGRRWTD